jgi:hypothetical protein
MVLIVFWFVYVAASHSDDMSIDSTLVVKGKESGVRLDQPKRRAISVSANAATCSSTIIAIRLNICVSNFVVGTSKKNENKIIRIYLLHIEFCPLEYYNYFTKL